MKNKFLLFLTSALIITSCIVEPYDIDSEVDCVPESFVGEWVYVPKRPNDTLPKANIIIELSTEEDDRLDQPLKIGNIFYRINKTGACTIGETTGLVDGTFELKSEDELIERLTVFALFGSTYHYRRLK